MFNTDSRLLLYIIPVQRQIMQQLSIVTNYSRFSKAKEIELLVCFEMCNTTVEFA